MNLICCGQRQQMKRQAVNGSNFPMMSTTFSGEKDEEKVLEAYKKIH